MAALGCVPSGRPIGSYGKIRFYRVPLGTRLKKTGPPYGSPFPTIAVMESSYSSYTTVYTMAFVC